MSSFAHRLAGIPCNSSHREAVFDVDVAADSRAINAGESVRIGETPTINGRRYRIDQPNTLYPIAGEGLIPASQGTCKAGGIYNQYGLTSAAEYQIDQSLVPADSRQEARRILRLGGLIS